MKTPVILAIIGFITLFILHHDFWNWSNTSLVLGFMPVGLAYHAAFSIVAGLFWFLVSRFAWPHASEAWADQPND
jgi:hypothetical protein